MKKLRNIFVFFFDLKFESKKVVNLSLMKKIFVPIQLLIENFNENTHKFTQISF